MGSPAIVHAPGVPADWVIVVTLVAPLVTVTVTPVAGALSGRVVTDPDSEPADRASVSWTPVSFCPSVNATDVVCVVKPGEVTVTVYVAGVTSPRRVNPPTWPSV